LHNPLGYPEEIPDLSMGLALEAVLHHKKYQIPSADDIWEWDREREDVWDTASGKLKERLAIQEIFSISQANAVQKYSVEVAEGQRRWILDNL